MGVTGTSQPFHRVMANPLSGSPNEFGVYIGGLPGLLGNTETEEALARVIIACQEAGEWVGLDVGGFFRHEVETFELGAAVSVLSLGGYGQGLLVNGFERLEQRGLIEIERGDDHATIWPTQALVDLPELQRYRQS